MFIKFGLLETGTEFSYEGRTFVKGYAGIGFGENGKGVAHPKFGGRFQYAKELEIWFENKTEVKVY